MASEGRKVSLALEHFGAQKQILDKAFEGVLGTSNGTLKTLVKV